MKLSFGYSDSEDRVWLRIEGSASIWWLTRRIAFGLLQKWAELIERSYREKAEIPGENTARALPARAGTAHRAAVSAARPVDPLGRPPAGVEMTNRVVSSIDLTLSAGRFTLVFKGLGAQDTIRLTREEAHRMLDALHQRCRHSGWFQVAMPGWLARDAQEGEPAVRVATSPGPGGGSATGERGPAGEAGPTGVAGGAPPGTPRY